MLEHLFNLQTYFIWAQLSVPIFQDLKKKLRYMGTIVGINDVDPLRWPSSKRHNERLHHLEVGFCFREKKAPRHTATHSTSPASHRADLTRA
ncbi:hypothetical protein L1887_13804 [Cichorium endivia]|nr:hypothetical protein L1887_13804 [Cichorium endivia]